MNYIGSKFSLLQFLDESITRVVGARSGVFCDLFAGTGAVGCHFKKKGFKVIANDIQYYSYVLNKHYIGNHQLLNFHGLISIIPGLADMPTNERAGLVCNYLSKIDGVEGFVYKNFCPSGTVNSEFPRQYFSDYNGKLCDAVRQTIDLWHRQKLINENEMFFLLTSLLESIDRCANTASVYGAFLKQIKKTAQNKLSICPAEIFLNEKEHSVYNKDINLLVKEIGGDILYLDPPYNHRQYATNYHVLETIARYDAPKLHGKTGLREYQEQKSLYCSRSKVKKVFAELIKNCDFKYIFLSYNNEGLMSLGDIEAIMSSRGEYGYFTKDYIRFKADQDKNRSYKADKTVEYLHYVKVKKTNK